MLTTTIPICLQLEAEDKASLLVNIYVVENEIVTQW